MRVSSEDAEGFYTDMRPVKAESGTMQGPADDAKLRVPYEEAQVPGCNGTCMTSGSGVQAQKCMKDRVCRRHALAWVVCLFDRIWTCHGQMPVSWLQHRLSVQDKLGKNMPKTGVQTPAHEVAYPILQARRLTCMA